MRKIYYVLVIVFLLMELSYNTMYSYNRVVDLNGGVCIAGRLKGKGKS